MLFNLIISEKDARMRRGMFSGRESTAGELELERGFAGGGKNSLAARSCHCSGIWELMAVYVESHGGR